MRVIFWLVVIAALAASYWFLLRPVLMQRKEFAGFYAKLAETEAGWWLRFRMSIKGLKTLLLARLIGLATAVLPILSAVSDGSLDLTNMLPSVEIFGITISSTQYMTFIVGPLIAWAFTKLRQVTTTEVGEPLPPEIAQEVRTEVVPESVSKVSNDNSPPAPPPAAAVEKAVAAVVEEKAAA